MIQYDELNTPNLNPMQKMALVLASNISEQGIGEVEVSMTYNKVTDSQPSLPGIDYVARPGVSPLVQMGVLRVKRYVDNAYNRKRNRVGKVYFMVDSEARGDLQSRTRPRHLLPEGIKAFTVTFVRSKQPVGV